MTRILNKAVNRRLAFIIIAFFYIVHDTQYGDGQPGLNTFKFF